jgi:hypothetical protein
MLLRFYRPRSGGPGSLDVRRRGRHSSQGLRPVTPGLDRLRPRLDTPAVRGGAMDSPDVSCASTTSGSNNYGS